MASITANGSKGHHKFTLTVTENSTSVSDNTSSVSFSFQLSPIQTGWNWSSHSSIQYTVTINGTQYTGTIPNYNGSSTVTVASNTLTVSHNSDGSKSIDFSFSVTDGSGASYTCGNARSSGSMALTNIPRASSFGSVSGNTIGSSMTVNINRNSSSFTHTIWYKLGNSGWITAATGVGTSATFTVSNDLLNQLPSSTSGTLQINIQTYNGSTKIGSEFSKTLTVYVSSSVVPTVGTVSFNPYDINSNNILVQGKNKLEVLVSGCSAGAGSSISSYTYSGPGLSYTGTGTVATCGPISSSGSLTYTVTVTDARGRTASKSASITCHAYSTPRFTSFSAYRCNSSGTASDSGTYIKCSFKHSFASVNSTNDVTITMKYKKSSASSWTSVTALSNSTSTSGSKISNAIDAASTYDVYAEITDNYSGKASSTQVIIFGPVRALNISSDGTGFAIGKMAEQNSLFECRWDAKFGGTVSGPSGFSTSSDERVKKNVQDIDLDIIDKLRPIQYELVKATDGKTHYGFIAQEVEALLQDEGIDTSLNGIIGHITNDGREEYVLTYTEFIPLLAKKCQDLQTETNMLKQELTELKDMIRNMST